MCSISAVSRPGLAPRRVSRRGCGGVRPVVEAIAADGGPAVSIDTSKSAVAAAALDAGATIVNDVTALQADPDLAALCGERQRADLDAHAQRPADDAENPTYDDVVEGVRAFLAGRIRYAVSAGVDEERIWVDPRIGFGKTVGTTWAHRLVGELARLGRPIAFGSSRKSFIGKLTGAEVDQRLGRTIASNVIAYANGNFYAPGPRRRPDAPGTHGRGRRCWTRRAPRRWAIAGR